MISNNRRKMEHLVKFSRHTITLKRGEENEGNSNTNR